MGILMTGRDFYPARQGTGAEQQQSPNHCRPWRWSGLPIGLR